ncbi:MAG TPA: IS110 family transposase [Bacteroidia bacterium]|nr:IS110 family transposase [Bacteroidia bacterium]
MKKYLVTVGIDVSKSKLDVRFVFEPANTEHPHIIVANNEKGIKGIISFLKKQKIQPDDALFCFENTGLYSMPLSIYFSKQQLDYWEIPAVEIKRSKGISRGKNDKVDAKDIAFYAVTHGHKLKLSQIPEQDILKLQLLYSEREKLLKAIHAMEASVEATNFLSKEVTNEVMAINKKTVAQLKVSLKKIDAAIIVIVKSNKQLEDCFQLATSVPGVGKQSAIYLIIKTRCFTRFKNWRKLACYAGIAPFEYSSGSSIKGKTKVSHVADKKMKSLLNMAALSAKKYDKEISDYYVRKINEGKNPMLVMNAIRCKILSRVFAVINRQTPFVNTQKFAA